MGKAQLEDELAKQVQAGASAGCGSVHRVQQQGRRALERGLVVVYDDSGRGSKKGSRGQWMCRYSLLFSSGLAPALGWEMEQSCQSRWSLDRHGGLNGRIAGFVGAVWPRGNSEMKEEKQEIRARGRCFSKAPRSGKR